jgi:hypothetical protein
VVLKFIDRTLKADPKSSISCDRVYDWYCAWSLSMRIEPIPHHAFRDNLNHFVQECLQGKVTHVQGEDDVYHGLTI